MDFSAGEQCDRQAAVPLPGPSRLPTSASPPAFEMVVSGVTVKFPFTPPYRSQLALMHNVIKVALEGKNALIESPTGTGKSISLLCAALAYQGHVKKTLRKKLEDACSVDGILALASGLNAACLPGSESADTAIAKRLEVNQPELDPRGLDSKESSKFEADSATGCPSTPNGEGLDPSSSASPRLETNANGVEDALSPVPSTDAQANAGPVDVDEDDDFCKTQQFRDASWQLGEASRRRNPTAEDEEPENAHLPSQLIAEATYDPRQAVDDEECNGKSEKLPRIFYASRTHAQITQVVGELRKSGYRPRMTVLASRSEYCINLDVTKLKSSGARDDKCRMLVKEAGCPQYHRVPAVVIAKKMDQEPWDIEDLKSVGIENNGCPYYASGELYSTAELILCPYNYLIDPLVREARGISLKGDIVILDEAHNIEDHARESASFSRDTDELRTACQEIQELLLSGRLGITGADLQVAYSDILELLSCAVSLVDKIVESGELKADENDEYAIFEDASLMTWMNSSGFLVERLKGWQGSLDRIRESKDEDYHGGGSSARGSHDSGRDAGRQSSGNRPGRSLFGRKRPRSLTAELPEEDEPAVSSPVATATPVPIPTYGAGYGGYDEAIEALASGSRGSNRVSGSRRRRESTGRPTVMAVGLAEKLVMVLGYCLRHADCYALAIKRIFTAWESRTELNLWCLNPALPFSALSRRARTVIVTSGTLSPIDSFTGELGTEFAAAKSLPHVIDVRKQLFASVVAVGPRNVVMDATYRGSTSFDFQDSLGDAILDYCRVIPGGVLVFLPSYRLLKTLSLRWESSGMWSKFKAVKSVVVSEPNTRGDEFDVAISSYTAAANSEGGSLMFGVCRGKISEGLDFKDASARAVLIVGIPYPSARAPDILRKRAWNDRERKNSDRKELLSGAEWYDMQAFRALNQALGRCVRHRRDYGAIVLLDARFRLSRNLRQLPLWTRDAMRLGDGAHGETVVGLSDFFKDVEQNLPPQ